MTDTIPLKELDAVIFDCQATGQNPDSGIILELGWKSINSSLMFGNANSYSELVNPGDVLKIPNRVLKITGISKDDLMNGSKIEEVWSKFIAFVKKEKNTLNCPIIIHYARFEKPWLKVLYKRYSKMDELPHKIICTHEISKRLLPDIPRRGLRAVAGYFGFSTDEFRRCIHHVEATAFIWSHIVSLFEKKHGVYSFGDLKKWLKMPVISSQSVKKYPMEKSMLSGIPCNPGVYRMIRSNGDILYIGKSHSLKKRVSSYFQKKTGHSEHILEMLSQAKKINYTVTGSALEAALLESDEIKRIKPPYNKALKINERELLFYSKDMAAFSSKHTGQYPIGPVPAQYNLLFFSQLIYLYQDWKNRISDSLIILDSLFYGINDEFKPDKECIEKGINLFFDTHYNTLKKGSLLTGFKKIALESWIRKIDEQKRQNTIDTQEKEKKEDFEWTPLTVAHAIERSLRYGMCMIRRARWYCILSEST
ncbi:MAG: exonuclease domain-containing protein, partial [Chitinispirillia bacterium]